MRLLFKIVVGAELFLAVAAMVPAVFTYLVTGYADWQNLWFTIVVLLFAGFHIALYPVGDDAAEPPVHPLQSRWRRGIWSAFLAILFIELLVGVFGLTAFLLDNDSSLEQLLVAAVGFGIAGVMLAILVRPASA